MSSPYILTHTGAKLYADAEQPDFRIIDIAHGLAMKCRWSGQCSEFFSVAQHAVFVAEIMQKLDLGDPFEGLHHDDTEAYFPDMPTPWKRILPDFAAMNATLERKHRAWLGLPAEMSEGCKMADTIALIAEARALTYGQGKLLHIMPQREYMAFAYADAFVLPPSLSPLGARCSYLFTHDKLARKRK